MKYLFSHEARPVLERLATENPLIALDFDGTLAPIVRQPPNAHMSKTTARELDQLCNSASVAILSGRAVGDLEQRISANVAYLIGNHGNEGLPDSSVDANSCRATCDYWVQQLQRLPALHEEGVVIESKQYTIAVHFRGAKDHFTTHKMLAEVFLGLVPQPRVVNGKCVFDLIPPGALCKDDAMDVLVKKARPSAVLYVGDDECDELVFSSAQPNWVTVRIGYRHQSNAQYFLRHQREMRYLLSYLNLHLRVTASSGV